MTNKEKARELISGMTNKWGPLMAFHKLTLMAEWKDQKADLLAQVAYESGYDKARQEMKEYLEKKRDKWQSAYEETQDSDYYAVYNTLAEIINELFKED